MAVQFMPDSYAQDLSSDKLDNVNGIWEGTLTYTDYSDDIKTSTLDTKMTAQWRNGKGSLQFEYGEPNGKTVKGKQKIKLGKSSKEFYIDGKWKVNSFEQNSDGSNWTLIIEKEGKDNNRNSVIRQEISLTDKAFEIVKEVRYDGTTDFFERNRHTLVRKD